MALYAYISYKCNYSQYNYGRLYLFFFTTDDDYAPVGFSAYATTSEQYYSGDLVVFSGVISNIGNHYDPNTSKFTCPYNGLYLFSLNMNAYSDYYMYAEIVRDDEYLVEAMAYNYDSLDYYPHASAFTITECNIGQAVWVRGGSNSDYMYGSRSERTSHFSGALIYAYVQK